MLASLEWQASALTVPFVMAASPELADGAAEYTAKVTW